MRLQDESTEQIEALEEQREYSLEQMSTDVLESFSYRMSGLLRTCKWLKLLNGLSAAIVKYGGIREGISMQRSMILSELTETVHETSSNPYKNIQAYSERKTTVEYFSWLRQKYVEFFSQPEQ